MSVESRPFDHDPLTATIQTWHTDHADGKAYLETRQDVTEILETNKAMYADIDERARWPKEMARVASIPMVVIEQLAKQGILYPGGAVKDEKALRKWLDDPANKYFRTRPGKLSR